MKKAAIQKYETGDVTDLKSSKIRTLCKTFHVHPWVFIYDDYDDIWNEVFDRDPKDYRKPVAETLNERVLVAIKKTHGEDSMALSIASLRLNRDGKLRALNYIDDLLKIDQYRSNCGQSK